MNLTAEYFIRIGLAGLCGIIIGAERQHRTKSAGVRTHFMISVATALMMLISKYGFLDIAGLDGMSCDVSRVAAGIISGVGLLGGGLIFMGKQGYTKGITTASGIWVTIAIGMAFGAGMYILGIGATVFVMAAQFLFHSRLSVCREQRHATIVFETGHEDYNELLAELEEYGAKVLAVKWDNKGKSSFQMKCQVVFPGNYSREQVTAFVLGRENVNTFEWYE